MENSHEKTAGIMYGYDFYKQLNKSRYPLTYHKQLLKREFCDELDKLFLYNIRKFRLDSTISRSSTEYLYEDRFLSMSYIDNETNKTFNEALLIPVQNEYDITERLNFKMRIFRVFTSFICGELGNIFEFSAYENRQIYDIDDLIQHIKEEHPFLKHKCSQLSNIKCKTIYKNLKTGDIFYILNYNVDIHKEILNHLNITEYKIQLGYTLCTKNYQEEIYTYLDNKYDRL